MKVFQENADKYTQAEGETRQKELMDIDQQLQKLQLKKHRQSDLEYFT